jgi:5'-nucleotidase (lipoprotein e(P4) family)
MSLRPTLLAAALLAALAGCATTVPVPVAAAPAPVAVVATVPANDNLNAVLWQQGSVEYRLIAGQTYRSALTMLDKAIKAPDWDALPRGERTVPARGLPPAVIVDVDETVLDNSIFQARLVAKDTGYDEFAWHQWVEERAATPVPGALEFARAAAARGVTVYYITNRAQDMGEATLDNLKALGFPVTDPGQFLGLGALVDDCESEGSEKSCRRQLVGRTHRVLMEIGDQLGDFVAVPANTPSGREQAVRPYLAWIGERWFVLPNPTYGSWEPALFGNDWHQSDAERRAAKRASLRLGNPPPASNE